MSDLATVRQELQGLKDDKKALGGKIDALGGCLCNAPGYELPSLCVCLRMCLRMCVIVL